MITKDDDVFFTRLEIADAISSVMFHRRGFDIISKSNMNDFINAVIQWLKEEQNKV